MYGSFSMDPFGTSVPGIETFNPYRDYAEKTDAALYGGDPCDPPPILNDLCPD